VGDNTLTFVVDNSGGGATGLKVDNIVATVQGHALELDVSLAGTGAVANDTLTFTALENGVTTSTSHVLTSYDISHGVTETAHQAANAVSTYTATLTDKAGNVSTLATETVFGSGDHAVSDGVGVDTFKWTLASNGSSSAATTTTISNFDLADHASGGSALDLKDLLQGENHASGTGNLTSYLHFTQSGSDTGACQCFGWFCQQHGWRYRGHRAQGRVAGRSGWRLGQYLGYADHPEPAEPRQADHRLKPAQPTKNRQRCRFFSAADKRFDAIDWTRQSRLFDKGLIPQPAIFPRLSQGACAAGGLLISLQGRQGRYQ
jgi:hypothetical protein